MQKQLLLITLLFLTNDATPLRQPYPVLTQEIHLKHHLIWIRFKLKKQSTFCCWDTIGRLGPPQISVLSSGASPPGPPVLNLSEHEPCRTWYMFYGHVTLDVYTIFWTENSTAWKCILFSELKTQGRGSVCYFGLWKPKALEMYTVVGTENRRI